VIVAGNYDFNGVPEAFYRLSELVPGDLIQINTSDGRTLAYGRVRQGHAGRRD
jgi:hypothetical protein